MCSAGQRRRLKAGVDPAIRTMTHRRTDGVAEECGAARQAVKVPCAALLPPPSPVSIDAGHERRSRTTRRSRRWGCSPGTWRCCAARRRRRGHPKHGSGLPQFWIVQNARSRTGLLDQYQLRQCLVLEATLA